MRNTGPSMRLGPLQAPIKNIAPCFALAKQTHKSLAKRKEAALHPQQRQLSRPSPAASPAGAIVAPPASDGDPVGTLRHT